MSSSESIVDEIEFTWKIENFAMHRQNTGEAIQSPPLSVGDPRHSVWMLKLYPRGLGPTSENIWTTELVRLDGSLKGRVVCKVLLVAGDGNTVEGPLTTNLCSFLWNHKGLATYKEKRLMPEEYLELFLPNDTMTLRCHLSFFGDPPGCVDELRELSESFGRLLDSGDCSDLVLVAGGREFLVHRAILKQRAPKLFKDLRLSSYEKNQRVEVKDISAPVLEAILSYLYRGKLSVDGKASDMSNHLGEMIEVAEKLDLLELTGEVISLSSGATIFTHIKTVRRTIDWVIEPDHQDIDGKPVSRIINFGPVRFLANLQFHGDEVWFKKLVISFRCLSISEEEDVYLSCLMTVADRQCSIRGWPKRRFYFSKDSPEQRLPKYEFLRSRKEALKVNLSLRVSDGKETHSIEGATMSSSEVSSFFGMSLLRFDLQALFEETQSKNGGDVTLVFKDQTMRADRAILAAMSPVFAGMFAHDMTEKNTDIVDILDIDRPTALRLVRFMYSGNVSKQSFAEDSKLYTAADKYQVTTLFKKCSGFLVSDLALNNACNVLTMAYMHNDNELMDTVLEFFNLHKKEVLGTSDWKSLCDANPRLADLLKEEIV